ncbi:MAG: DUF6048 family protein [Paludibacteraceae bacterium]|nr:DUF6048 family protein [Paludibacteraceae bacterium]
MRKYLLFIVCLSAVALSATAQTYEEEKKQQKDSAIYQGTYLKLDLFNPVFEAARSKGGIQDYELCINVRLKQRFYPTLELGYAQAQDSADGGHYDGRGGFLRAGLDFNGLRKHPESPHALLVGLRIGTSYQGYNLTGVIQNSSYWEMPPVDYTHLRHADAWGEVVIGCQVQIAKGFHMGWDARFKLLFTRNDKNGGPLPYYIPGYGYRSDTNWGFHYYIGWKF